MNKQKLVNGKEYPMWSQFVENKDQYIGGVLEEHDYEILCTPITDITLEPNGDDSAFFAIEGEEFTCGFDVGHGGLTSGEEGWITFYGYAGQMFRIEKSHNENK